MSSTTEALKETTPMEEPTMTAPTLATRRATFRRRLAESSARRHGYRPPVNGGLYAVQCLGHGHTYHVNVAANVWQAQLCDRCGGPALFTSVDGQDHCATCSEQHDQCRCDQADHGDNGDGSPSWSTR